MGTARTPPALTPTRLAKIGVLGQVSSCPGARLPVVGPGTARRAVRRQPGSGEDAKGACHGFARSNTKTQSWGEGTGGA